jgi:peptidoglycan/xylan/chitin deacetylase (PgdA/CDA1 family)
MSAIHLTFDNGPDPVGTPAVLAALGRWGVDATFFVLGKHLATGWGRDLALRCVDEGHRLGNHSYTHEIPLGLDPRPNAVELELGRTQELLDPIASGARWVRPFGGGGLLGPHLLSRSAVAWMVQQKVTCVLWNSVPRDWENPDRWVERALDHAADGEPQVVVVHDVVPAAMAHLDRFLRLALDAGHFFVDTLPSDCLPIVDGTPQPGLDRYVQASPSGVHP